MDTLTTNFVKTRTATLNGREHWVAKCNLIVPGVLNGSNGPLLYPSEECARSPSIWNHVPATVRHPTLNGQPTTAKDPNVLNAQGVGVVLSTQFTDKLTGEIWIDIANARRLLDPDTLARIENGLPVEVSTGLNMKIEASKGVHNGVEYVGIARNYIPDHLAILPDQVGACSVADGCGLNVNKVNDNSSNSKDPTMATENKAKTELVDYITANCECWKGDAETLNGFDEDKLKKLKANIERDKQREAVLNAAKKGYEHGNAKFRLNDKGEWEKEEVVTANNGPNDSKTVTPPATPVTNNEGKTPETKQPIKLEDLPADIQQDIQFARNERDKQRSSILERLVANIKGDDEKARHRKVYEKLSLNELRDIDPGEPQPKADDKSTPHYYGAQGVATNSGKKLEPAGGQLGLPTINWAE